MAFALAKEQIRFIDRMIRSGRYNSQSEVVRAALRYLEEEESDYLSPPVLTQAQIERIYGTASDAKEERNFGRAAFVSVRRAARKGRRA